MVDGTITHASADHHIMWSDLKHSRAPGGKLPCVKSSLLGCLLSGILQEP